MPIARNSCSFPLRRCVLRDKLAIIFHQKRPANYKRRAFLHSDMAERFNHKRFFLLDILPGVCKCGIVMSENQLNGYGGADVPC
jgi:hypothetical protein